MARFEIVLESHLAPEQAWSRIWDLDRHTAVIPLTTVTPDPPATGLAEGVGFTGRTALGPVGFDDTMRVVSWQPPTGEAPGTAVVNKTGRLLGGRIEVTVAPFAGGSRVTWRQELALPWLPSPLRALERPAAAATAPGYRLVLSRLLGE